MSTIAQCAHLAHASYFHPTARANLLAEKSLLLGNIAFENEIKSRNGYQGFIAYNADTIYIVFEGTASPEDLVQNAKVLKTYNYFFLDKKLVGIHAGFHELFSDVWPTIKEYIGQTDQSKNIVVTGHSLGGAIATLVGAALSVYTKHKIEVVTFGCPRVGNRAFRDKYNQHVPLSTRVVRDIDIVPRIPKIDYWHVNQLVHISDGGKIIPAWKSWLKQIWYIYKNVHGFVSKEALEDHDMSGYIKAVELMK